MGPAPRPPPDPVPLTRLGVRELQTSSAAMTKPNSRPRIPKRIEMSKTTAAAIQATLAFYLVQLRQQPSSSPLTA
jgi:hypothetical protein